MTTTSAPVVRPGLGSHIAVAFSDESITGTVTTRYEDGFDVRRDDDGTVFTLYDVEQINGTATITKTGRPIEVIEHVQHSDHKSRVVVIFADRPPITKVIGDRAVARKVAEFAARRTSAVEVHLVVPAKDTPPMHCGYYVPGDPTGCARCGERPDLHEAAG